MQTKAQMLCLTLTNIEMVSIRIFKLNNHLLHVFKYQFINEITFILLNTTVFAYLN